MRALTLALLCFALPAAAQDLAQVFRDGKTYDAAYASAKYALQAGLEKLPQGRALLLPTLNLTAATTSNHLDLQPYGPNPVPAGARNFSNRNYQLTFAQPVFRAQNWAQFDQAEQQVRQAEATFGQAAQDLILRVAQNYFDTLAAQDLLALNKAQRIAIAEQLAQAKRNFEVGTATITDTHEAQARYDLASANVIVAENAVETQLRQLQQITGKRYENLRPLRATVKLTPPNPNNMQSWVDIAEKQGFPVQLQEATTEIANLQVKFARAGHYPTLDLVGTFGQTDQTGTTISAFSSQANLGTVGLQLALPLYQGGAISSREREAAANFDKARQDLENVRRSQALQARQTYLLVINGISVVNALEQAEISSQSAYDSNKLGYEVGVRINIDVLNAQQQVFSTRRDLLVARYGTITNHLKLKAAAGSLREEDLEEVNRALEP
ncbi:MAG TPA: TolC family outer membrane protein [Burkholderiales bacterium]|nr:TolC family outer membrane protein [Burkholderiales bacterium]